MRNANDCYNFFTRRSELKINIYYMNYIIKNLKNKNEINTKIKIKINLQPLLLLGLDAIVGFKNDLLKRLGL
jgi:hypothetical protein